MITLDGIIHAHGGSEEDISAVLNLMSLSPVVFPPPRLQYIQ